MNNINQKSHLQVAYRRLNLEIKTHKNKVRSCKKLFHTNGNKKARVAILISDKTDFKTKSVIRDRQGHYLMIEGSIQKEDITVINIYVPT